MNQILNILYLIYLKEQIVNNVNVLVGLEPCGRCFNNNTKTSAELNRETYIFILLFHGNNNSYADCNNYHFNFLNFFVLITLVVSRLSFVPLI